MTHRNIDAASESITTYLENTADDIILNVAPLAFAAAQLFHATGKPGYHEDFLANTPWRANPQAEMIAGDGAYDLSLAACAYALMPDAQADAAVKRAALACIRREADKALDAAGY